MPGVRCVAGEPATSQALSPAPARSPAIASRAPAPASCRASTARDLADAVVAGAATPTRSRPRGGWPARKGIFGGISSGANVWIALQRARALPAGARIVTTVCDSGLKYLRGELYRS